MTSCQKSDFNDTAVVTSTFALQIRPSCQRTRSTHKSDRTSQKLRTASVCNASLLQDVCVHTSRAVSLIMPTNNRSILFWTSPRIFSCSSRPTCPLVSLCLSSLSYLCHLHQNRACLYAVTRSRTTASAVVPSLPVSFDLIRSAKDGLAGCDAASKRRKT
jgi:hypothetical protein